VRKAQKCPECEQRGFYTQANAQQVSLERPIDAVVNDNSTTEQYMQQLTRQNNQQKSQKMQ